MPTTTTVSDARRDFADLVNRVAYGRQHVLIERHRRPVAAVVSIRDYQALCKLRDAIAQAKTDRAAEALRPLQP